MSSSTKMLLEIWKGNWNLPSVDPECLRAITYARFSEAPVSFVVNTVPWSAPGRSYPVLTTASGQNCLGADSVIRYLQSEGFRCPHETAQMTAYEEADAYALETYLKSAVLPLLEYLWWVEDDIFRRVALPWYNKELSYYGQFVWMNQQRRRVVSRLHLTPDAVLLPSSDVAIRQKLVSKARQCLDDLSVRLADKTFLFGLKPSALDACVFGYLAPLLYIPWKSKELRKDLFADQPDKFRNLKALVDRINKRYFEGDYFKVDVVQRPLYWYDKVFERIRRHSDILLFCGAAVALNLYLLNKTITRLRFRWPSLDDHARQRVQETSDIAKSLGLTGDIPFPPIV